MALSLIRREKFHKSLPSKAKLAFGLHPSAYVNEEDHEMTYCYTRSEAKVVAKTKRFTDYATKKFDISKAVKPKTVAIVTATAVIGALLLMPSSAKTTKLPTTAQLADSASTLEAPLATPVETTASASNFVIPENLSYRGLDNAIRDVQIDNAHLGHKMKMAMISDKNPIKHVYIWMERKFSFPALLVALAFIISLMTLGFIRPSNDDMYNY